MNLLSKGPCSTVGATRAAAGVRVGVDVVAVSRVAASIDRFGDRYRRRVYTPSEIRDCGGNPASTAERLAARFAAKEAVIKALGAGDDAPSWTDIGVRRSHGGAPLLELTDHAAELAHRLGLTSWSVSLTHEAGLAAAVVVAAPEGFLP